MTVDDTEEEEELTIDQIQTIMQNEHMTKEREQEVRPHRSMLFSTQTQCDDNSDNEDQQVHIRTELALQRSRLDDRGSGDNRRPRRLQCGAFSNAYQDGL
jgi:hypothetical protein